VSFSAVLYYYYRIITTYRYHAFRFEIIEIR